MSTLLYDSIIIIQSLSESDPKTGKRLYEDLDLLNAIDRAPPPVLLNVISKAEFFTCLKDIIKLSERGATPLLHIEAHGSNDKTGIILASGEYISWGEMKPFLVKLNIATKHNLLIVLAVCHGGHLTETLLPTERSPCWGLVGPTDTVKAENLLRDFSKFYKELLETGNGDQAVKALNSGTSPGAITYYFTTAERLFKLSYIKYLKHHCTDEMYRKRARYVRKELKKKGNTNVSIGQLFRKYKSSEQEYFEKNRKHFFMLDFYPEIEGRISITFRDVK